jgi:hypothetical protein
LGYDSLVNNLSYVEHLGLFVLHLIQYYDIVKTPFEFLKIKKGIYMKKILCFFSILYILSMVFWATGASASWNAYVVSSGVKYRPWDNIPTTTSLTINAARGQWASFQIACKVSNEDVSGVDVSATTPTNGSFA